MMNYGQRLSLFFKGKAWDYVKNYPVKVVASVTAGVILGSSPFVFSVERFLLKSRIQFGYFVPKDEKFQDGTFQETSSSKILKTIISPEVKANSYYMITGEHGIGKSSASTHGADELGHSGIVYIKVPRSGDPKEFEKSLAQRLFLYHMIYDKLFSYLSLFTGMILLDVPDYDGDKKSSYLTILIDKLCVLSHQYKRWHDGKGLVLVIDQVNHFFVKDGNGKSHEYYLDILQNTAKDLAVSNHFILLSLQYVNCLVVLYLRIAKKSKSYLSRAKEKLSRE
jgi:Cdc6-like AAA superfamily ATPase